MNFLPGQLEGDGTVVTALGEAQLPDRVRQAVERSESGGKVILGIRPEHFEDAALVGDKPGGDVRRADRPRRVDGLGHLRVLHA